MSVVFIKVSVACRYDALDSMLITGTIRTVCSSDGQLWNVWQNAQDLPRKEICSLLQLSKIKGTVPSEEMIFLFYPRQAGAKPEESQEKTEFLREKQKSSVYKEERNAKGSRSKMHHFLNPQWHNHLAAGQKS